MERELNKCTWFWCNIVSWLLNYPLCRSAVENEKVFGEVAASALHYNLYEDDLEVYERLRFSQTTCGRFHKGFIIKEMFETWQFKQGGEC